MTYVSRKTRIIVSGWPDECSAEYLIQAFRKRSDGKLKNYSSCDDIRAWINDNCVKNEYLLDLMSKSEFLGDPPFALYGRFIPVPILFKLLENGKKNDEKETREKALEDLDRVRWEKNQAEENLLECTCLLSAAVRKLEKLENIIEVAHSETQIARAKEIKDAFRKAKEVCGCSDCRSSSLSSLNTSENGFTSPVRMSKNPNAYSELMRKISQLKRKLEEVQSCRCQIIHRIRRAERCASSNQVKQLFNREDQDRIKKLQKELEKLIAEKGRLLCEMRHVLNSLNTLKISSKGNFSGRKGYRGSVGYCQTSGRCRCKSFENYESTDTENVEFMESTYGFDDMNGRTNNINIACDYSEPPEKLTADYGNEKPERLCEGTNVAEFNERHGTSSNCEGFKSPTSSKVLNRNQHSKSSKEKCRHLESAEEEKKVKTKKSGVKFICDSTPCRKILKSDELSAFESSLNPQQKAVISRAVRIIENLRPRTTPTTTREKRVLTLKSESPCENVNKSGKISVRRVKSETMIKEFEKTIRNYERRLNNLDFLECKVENLIQKSSEVCRLKKRLAKVKAEAKKRGAAEKDKFEVEITRLCSENWELKKHIQQLMVKFEEQCKKIQILKCGVLRGRELEYENEELKKELSEYRNGFEHQRKCISKWENVVAMQRTEIENLMNHIRKLTAVKEEPQCVSCQEKKYIPRSRSCSPETGKEKSRIRRKVSKDFRMTSEEEENTCCCGEHPQLEGRRKIQGRSLSRGCFSPANGNIHRVLRKHKQSEKTKTKYESSKMEGKDNVTKLEEKYKAQIEELKAQFIVEKEELTSLFLEKLKEVENYHKKMLQDLVIKSSTDLDAIQAKHEEKINFMVTVHIKELEGLQNEVQTLQSDKEELRKMLMAICEGQVVPKEKILTFLKNGSEKTLPQ